MTDEQTLEFWKNMALGLKDELVIRGDTIERLELQVVRLTFLRLAERAHTPQPLWDDSRIATLAEYAAGSYGTMTLFDARTIAAQIRDDYEAELAELRTAAYAAITWIDEIYPPDIFDGSSGDEGPVRIVAIRENLRRALEQP